MSKTTKNSGGTVSPVAPKAPVTLQSFFTRERANEGVKLPLSQPNGEATDYFIRVRGVDSDAYRLAQSANRSRALALIATEPKPEEIDAFDEAERITLLVALVIDWNLPEPCTPENIRTLLHEAPQIAKQIDVLTTRRSLFFKDSLKPSTASPAQASS